MGFFHYRIVVIFLTLKWDYGYCNLRPHGKVETEMHSDTGKL